MTNSFPPTILFSWSPPDGHSVSEEVMDMFNRLKVHSLDKPVNWEVTITMKKHKDGSSKMTPVLQRSMEKTDPIPPVYFFRFMDCGSICSIISNKENVYTCQDIISGDEIMENILTDYSHLVKRSSWRVYGQSFVLDKYIVSVGKMTQGSISNSIILEVSYVGEATCNNVLIYDGIYSVAKSMFPSVPNNSDTVYSFMEHKQKENVEDSISDQFCIEDRCLQWMTFLKMNA